MNCPDDLVQKIRNSPILPKPEVKELLYIWDWRSFVGPNLSGKKLQNHSFFFSFFLKKENGLAVFRGKKYPFNVEWTPESGIMLLKSNVDFVPVEASDFRIETLCIDKVFSDLYTKFFPTLETNERKMAEASWERLRTVLENLPKQQRNLAPMKILSFPKQFAPQPAVVPQYLDPYLNCETPELIGQICNVEPTESQFQADIQSGMDIAVYTESKKDRPWLGRVLDIQEGGKTFQVQWFKRKGKGSTFQALTNKDGTRYTSLLASNTVMLWEFTDKKTDDSFEVSKEWLEKIFEQYQSHDLCYE